MIRFIRALIYGAFAAVAATLLLDWFDRNRPAYDKPRRLDPGSADDSSIDQMGDDAKQALLDELAAQV